MIKFQVQLKLDDFGRDQDLLDMLALLSGEHSPVTTATIIYECDDGHFEWTKAQLCRILAERPGGVDAKLSWKGDQDVPRNKPAPPSWERPERERPIEKALREAGEAETTEQAAEVAVDPLPACMSCGGVVTPPQTFCASCMDLPDDEQED